MGMTVTYVNLTPCYVTPKLRRHGKEIALEALRGMDKFVPMDTGQLRSSAQAGDMEVIYGTDYAVYPYSGHGTIHRDKNPMATAHWDQAYQASGMQELMEAVKRYATE